MVIAVQPVCEGVSVAKDARPRLTGRVLWQVPGKRAALLIIQRAPEAAQTERLLAKPYDGVGGGGWHGLIIA